MSTKIWESPPQQADIGGTPERGRNAEPRNFETMRRDDGLNPDAAPEEEWRAAEYEDINLHGSER